jgi:peptidoglycan/xylan/chitin deacetylase (PgdA/CDA1 family)
MKIFLKILIILFSLFLPLIVTTPAFAVSSIRVPILMYHYIRDYNYPKDKTGMVLSVSPTNFDQQMSYLSTNGYTPVTLGTLAAIYANQAQAPTKPVVITFDDGYIDFYANAFPILRKYGFHAVSFIISGFVGKPAYMSWDNIKELQKSGLVSFEAHTVNHAYLPGLSYAQMVKELQDSKSAIQSQTGVPVNFVAYPSGGTNSYVIKAAQNVGYVGGLSTWFGKAGGINMNMPRIRVNGGFNLALFASRL